MREENIKERMRGQMRQGKGNAETGRKNERRVCTRREDMETIEEGIAN